MIKNYLLSAFFLFIFHVQGQISTTSSSFTNGDIASEIYFGGNPTVLDSSFCTDTLKVTIPAGNYVYWIDVTYDVESANNSWMSEQYSYLECASTGIKESAISNGVGNSVGTYTYTRNNLHIADGVSATGILEFAIHPFRTFGGVGCDPLYSKVVDSTWTITVHHGTAPTCYQPLGLNVNWVTSNEANVNWITGGATNWQIEYGASGFTPGSGTLINATSNPFTISGLSASTNYDYYVRDSCGAADVSIWSPIDSFTTLCTPVGLPYAENFDGTSWTAGTGNNNTGAVIPTCWSQDPAPAGGFGAPFYVSPRSATTPTGNTGPSGDHTTGTANYIYSEASGGAYQAEAYMQSPLIDVSSLTLPEITIWYHMFGTSIGQLYVDIWDKNNGWNNVFSLSGAQQTSSTDAWKQANVSLPNNVGDTILYKVRFVRSFATQGDIAVDDISIQEAPTCPDPTDLVVDNFDFNTATLSWTSLNSTNWDIQYGSAGFTLGSGTTINTSSNPNTVTGLSVNTAYDFYVKSKCSTTDSSAWVGPVSITTMCSPIAAPYIENFDTTPWVAGTGVYSTGTTLGSCWLRFPGNGTAGSSPHFWAVRNGGTSTPNTGPSSDHTNGSGNYIYAESSAGSPNDIATIYTPTVNLTALTNPELRFWYHMFGGTMGSLNVSVLKLSNGTISETTVTTITGQGQTSSASVYKELALSLSAFIGDTIAIKFTSNRGAGNQSDIAIDDISIDEAITCPDPLNLIATGSTTNSISISWTTGGATNWNIAHGTPGFTPGTSFSGTSNNPYTISGLTSSTSYEVYVRDSCGSGDVSNWIGPVTITTLCAPVSAPFFENFDSTNWVQNGNFDPGVIDGCWNRTDTLGYFWKPANGGGTPTNNTGPTGDHTTGAGNFIYTETFNATGSTFIQTPPIDVSSLTVPELTFWYHMYGQLVNSLIVEINNGNGWTQSFSKINQQHSSSAAAWTKAIVDMSAYAGDTVIIRFKGTRYPGANNTVDMSVDDVSVHEKPTCPEPTNVSVTASTNSSVTLSWTTGGATSWNIEYGPIGFTPGSGTIVSATANPFSVTGLSASSNYDFYVRDSCGVGDVSLWVGPFLGSTNCGVSTAPYTENFDVSFDEGTGVQNIGSTINHCWTRNPATGYHWGGGNAGTPSGNTGPTTDHTSGTGNYVYVEASGGANGSTGELVSPQIDVSGLTSPELTFWYHMYGAGQGDFDVEINNGGTTWTNVLTLSGDKGNVWLEAIISLSAYAGDTIQVRFTGTRANSFQGDIAIDDLSIAEAPTCPKPTNLVVSSSASTSITLSWTTGGATAWDVEYGPNGFTLGSGTLVATTNNPTTITGLNSSQQYCFYVRDNCGSGDTSEWVGPVCANTLCGVVASPYTEDFESSNWVQGGNGAAGTIDSCWVRDATATYWWKPAVGAGTPSNNTGPTGDHTSGFGNFLYTEAGGFGGGSTVTNIETPLIDVSTLTTPELSFWYHMFGNEINKLEVSVFDGSTWAIVQTLTGAQQTAQANPWLESTISLSAYTGDTIQIKFTGTRNAGFQNRVDISIDDIKVDNAPNCPKPTALSVTNISATTATLSWTTGGATLWNVEYGPVGFTPGTGTILSATVNPFVVTGLTAATSYEFYVRDSCGTGNVSAWLGPVSGTTLCNVFVAPYNEDFEASSWTTNGTGDIDACWNRGNTNSYWWKPGQNGTPTGTTGPTGDHTTGSGKFMYTEAGGFGGGVSTTELTSPAIDVSSLTAPELRFWYHMFGTQINKLEVEVSDGTTWTNVQTLTGAQQTNQGDAWLESVVSLSAYIGDTIQLRFKGFRNTGFQNRVDIAIDDIRVANVPTCPKPSALSSTAQTTTSVTLSWTTGGATAWDIEYGAAGFTPGTGTIVSASSNPFTVNGLSPSQTYCFYVRDDCGSGDTSEWVGPECVSTACGTVVAPYFENFDVNFDEGTGIQNVGSTISTCWTRNPTSNHHWGGGAGGTGTGGTGPSADHTTGNGNYVYAEASQSTAGHIADLESPNIDLTALTSPELIFWYNMNGNNVGNLYVDIYNGTTWTSNVDSVIGNQGNTWFEKRIDLTSYATNTIKVRYRAQLSTGTNTQSSDIAIDDMSVDEAPTCPVPSGLSLLPLSVSSIQLSWTTGGASNWQIEYGTTGFTPGSGTIVNTSTNPHVVTGLTQGIVYDFYVRDSCGVSDLSDWIGPVSGQTLPCANGCTYTLDLTDANGNGWGAGFGGNVHSLNVTIGSTTTNYTLASGAAISYSLNVCDGDTVILSFVNSGFGSNQCGFVLKDGTGTAVYTQTSGNNIASGLVWSGSIACTSPCPAPIALFTYTMSGLQVNVDGSTSTGAGLTYDWDYGDGNNGTGVVDSNLYAIAGTYTITLVVTDVCGQTDTITQSVSPGALCPPPVAAFTETSTLLTTVFDASTSTGTTLTYDWDYGDGNVGTGVGPTHNYLADGNYNVVLIVTDICGNSDTITQSVQVCDVITADFTFSQSGLDVTFDGLASSAGASAWSWDFGDGNSGTDSVITHSYTSNGTYQVELTVTNICGQSATVTKIITLCVKPVAAFTWNVVSSGGAGMVVNFDGTGSQNATSYNWDFGDASTNTVSAIPQHTYSVPGLFYKVTLIVSNNCGDSDTTHHYLYEIGLEENDFDNSIKLFPNPSIGNINVDLGQSITDELNIEVYDMNGKVVTKQSFFIDGQEINLDFRELEDGVYFMSISSENNIWKPKRFVIQK